MRKSVNNIYKIPAKGGQPVQVTRHTDGNLFWPSMSSDGKVIVYEENFGIWKLDVATGKTSEIKLDITTDEKDNEVDVETVSNEVDAFDISPSGRRAVISARGQILTIATDRGDITRVAPDKMASRNESPKWSPDGKYIAFVSDRSGRDEVWISDPEGTSPKKITDLDNEKGALVWTPDSKPLLYTAADKKLYSYTVADGKTRVVSSSDVGRIGSVVGLARQQVGRVLQAGPHAPLARLHRRRSPAARSGTSRTTACCTPRTTRSGPPTAATSSSRRSKAPATASPRRAASRRRWRCGRSSLRDQDRDPMNRDIDNEAQGLAAEAAARQNAGRGGGGAPAGRSPHRLERHARGARGGSRCRARRSAASRRRRRGTRSR